MEDLTRSPHLHDIDTEHQVLLKALRNDGYDVLLEAEFNTLTRVVILDHGEPIATARGTTAELALTGAYLLLHPAKEL